MGKRIVENCYIKVVKTIKTYNMIEDGDKIVIGVSGGPDSICLLDILRKLQEQNCKKEMSDLPRMTVKFSFVVAHVNHMIRKEAKEDEEFVKNFCLKNNIQFYSKSIDVKKIANNNKISTEEAGRKARYEFFDEILQKIDGNKIAIAHNKNDKVETVIMNMLRGCGITGLKGIEPIRDKYIRPLIACERKEIETYCEENNLDPRIDKTNFENIYTRNKIRNIVIPYIKQEFNPNIVQTMDRLAKIVTEQEDYIQKQVKIVYQQIVIQEKINKNSKFEKKVYNHITDNTGYIKNQSKDQIDVEKEDTTKENKEDTKEYIILDLKGFNQQEKVIKSNIILYTITRLFDTSKGIEKIHIEDIINLCEKNIGNKFLKPNKNLKVFVKNGKIKISKEYE